ncbi:MAG: cell division protein FtsL [Candidatus Tectomicrobia bacterium]|uniref:Cell division protein FtsL n=1 Tax=Tectimicrobiota bacterium TaxID=2528274 RepID=A0A932I158_UNCTE|nr:cell division protein FtsL [Candidatus Tectomicrobia bacterium]
MSPAAAAGRLRRERRGGLSRAADKEFPLVPAALWLGMLALSALALVWPHLEMVKLGYELTRLEAERDRLIQEGRVLRVEEASLRQLDRIESIARAKLSMVFPVPEQIVYVKVPPGNWR